MKIPIPIACFILMCCVSVAETAEDPSWNRFHSLEGNFSVETQLVPRVQVIFHPDYVTTRYLFLENDTTWMILVMDLKRIDQTVPAINRLRSHIQAIAKDVQGELVWTESVGSNRLHYAMQEGDLHQFGALHASDTHVITIGRVNEGPAPKVWDKSDRLLNSLRTHSVDSTHYYAAREFLVANNVEILMAKGMRYTMDGQADEAAGVARVQALLAYEQAGPDSALTASYLEELGRSLISTRRFTEAAAHLLHAKRIFDKQKDDTSKQRLRICRSLGLIAQQVGRFTEAEKFLKDALRIAEQSSNQKEKASVMFAIAKLAHISGDPLRARKLATQWNEFAKGLPVKASGDVIFATDIDDRQANFDALMGSIERTRGEFIVARRHLERAIDAYESLPKPKLGRFAWPMLAANTRLTLGKLELDTENYKAARDVLSVALQQLNEDLGMLHPTTLEGLTDLAHAYKSLGDLDKARAMQTQILAWRRELFGETHHAVASTLASLSHLEFLADNPEAGYDHMMAATKMDLAIPPDQHPQLAAALQGRGNFLLLAKRYKAAEEMFTIAADTLAKRNIESPAQVIPVMIGRGQSLWGQEKYDAANVVLNRALATARDALGNDAPQVAIVMEKLADVSVSTEKISIAADQFHQSRQTMTRFVHGQLRELNESEQLKFLASEFQPAMHHAIAFAANNSSDQKVSEFAAQWLMNGKGVSVEALTRTKRDQMNDIRSPQWATIEQVQSKLGEREVLIDYFRVDDVVDQREPRYIACVIAGSGAPRLIELGPAEKIDLLVGQMRRSINDAPAKIVDVGEADAEATIRSRLRQVAKQLLDPCLVGLVDIDRLYISPDGVAWSVPWDALVTDDDQYAVERYSIGLLTSGRELLRTQDQAIAAKEITPAVVVADPAYGQSNTTFIATRGGDVPSVSRLQATAHEADVVTPLLSKMTQVPAIQLRDKAASEQRVRRLRRPSVLHMATHGFFQESNSSVRPLDRCGLMLAECNTGGDGKADGVWMGSEIAAADFQGTRLVVLSACDTGVGQTRLGEGIAGLRHAFHLAGAKSVVASLWKANDAETATMMKYFYETLERNSSSDVSHDVRDSLRGAKLRWLQVRRKAQQATHPVFWAAFDVTE